MLTFHAGTKNVKQVYKPLIVTKEKWILVRGADTKKKNKYIYEREEWETIVDKSRVCESRASITKNVYGWHRKRIKKERYVEGFRLWLDEESYDKKIVESSDRWFVWNFGH